MAVGATGAPFGSGTRSAGIALDDKAQYPARNVAHRRIPRSLVVSPAARWSWTSKQSILMKPCATFARAAARKCAKGRSFGNRTVRFCRADRRRFRSARTGAFEFADKCDQVHPRERHYPNKDRPTTGRTVEIAKFETTAQASQRKCYLTSSVK